MDTSLLPSLRDSFIISCLVVPIFAIALYFVPSSPKWKFQRISDKMANPSRYCPPPGYSLPVPVLTDISYKPTVISNEQLKSYSWFNTTTIAVKASIGDTQIFEYQSRPVSNSSITSLPSLFGTKFRIASVTKVFTVLAVLLSKDKIGWEDSITKYVPGLDATAYNDVTISGLAGQTSGLGRQGYVGDLSFLPNVSPTMLGIKPTNATLPGCDPFPGGTVCTPSQVLDMFNDQRYLPQAPESIPSYSNIAYNLLGLALESVYPGQSYEMIMKSLIFDPLGMNSTSFETPSNSTDAILPAKGESWFSQPFGNYNPSGGIWTTPGELHLFAHALRKHKLLSVSETKRWLQPRSFLPSLHQFVGAPWEILRPTDLDIKVPRPIDIYTKSGSVAGYTSYLILILEYDVVITINAAGNKATPAIQDLMPEVVKAVAKFADGLAREQALRKYVGTYKGASGSNSTLTLALDDEKTGLKVSEFIMNGATVIPGLAALQQIPSEGATARLYPTSQDDRACRKETWNLHIERPANFINNWAELDCATWMTLDPARYVGAPLHTMHLNLDGNGVKEIELPGWKTTLSRSL